MFAAQIMVPCFEYGDACQLDWAAISALGGWAAATVTVFAVLLPFRQYKKEIAERRRAELVDEQIAVRGSVVGLTSIYMGLRASGATVDQAEGMADFTESLEHIKEFVVPHPIPVFPRTPGADKLRLELAALETALGVLKNYIENKEKGHFDAGTVREYIETLRLSRAYFNDVLSALDAYGKGGKFSAVLPPFE